MKRRVEHIKEVIIMSKFALGREEDVRRIFSATIKLKIVPLGSNGFIVSGFSAVYPEKLNIFVPIDYVTNKVSNAIPAEFESFFRPIDSYFEYFYRLVEAEIPSILRGTGTEYIVGSFSGFDYKSGHHTTFAIPVGENSKASTLLCRRSIFAPDDIMIQESIKRIEAEFRPSFIGTAIDSINRQRWYLYWSMRPSQVFTDSELTLAKLMLTAPQ
ncbi:hypothetical protein IKE84_00945 [Candidatus Saccharibacteria bacterium]|nr:hypothetical protein [Candidatus Saccharibacteria bacterium]